MTLILGLNLSHNGSVALIRSGEVVSAIQAERISGVKRKALFANKEIKLVHDCVNYCLDEAGQRHEDINSIAISTPWEVKTFSNTELFDYIGGVPKHYLETFYVPHHYSHMEYILHYGSNEPGIVLVIDGSGTLEKDRSLFNIDEDRDPNIIDFTHFAGKEVISAYWFDGNKSSIIYKFCPSQAPVEKYNADADGLLQSIGHYWEWASLYCCNSRNEAGKVMGLAAFGQNDNITVAPNLSLTEEGMLKLNFAQLKSKFKEPNILQIDLSNSAHHQNIARKVQFETEEVIIRLIKLLKKNKPCKTLYLSGGVALNVVANERIINSKLFEKVILNGSVEDNGTAIGAAMAANVQLGLKRKSSKVTDYYGRIYSKKEIIAAITKTEFPYQIFTEEQMIEYAAELISRNNVVGWFQGKSEFGPRALGNRSILANPTSSETKHILDHYMKSRDRYRPYAPVVVEEEAAQYFDLSDASPVMMRNVKVLTDKLPSITHHDGTARVQTVNKNSNKILHKLLLKMKNTIGYPVLLNTSFNLPGEPIVETPKDALSSFKRGSLDYLFMENIVISRSEF